MTGGDRERAARAEAERDRRLGSAGLRALGAAALATLLVAAGVPSAHLLAVAVIAAAAFDGRHPLSLRNFFVVYVVAVFAVGGGALGFADRSVFGDVVAYLLAFLGGYLLGSLRHGPQTRPAPAPGGPGPAAAAACPSRPWWRPWSCCSP